jgi:3-oxoacyl-[acyl-carrier protein] reductase
MSFQANSLFWLTGASSGIGYAVAKELAEKKVSLIISSRNADKMGTKIDELKLLGAHSVETVPINIANGNSKGKIIEILKGRKINGLLLNGGGYPGKKLTEHDYNDFLEGNKNILAGPAQFLLDILPYFANENSSVVAITSTSVKEPVGQLHLSAIYRTGFVVFLKNLAHEIGHTGIRINNIAPGATATEHMENLIQISSKNNNISLEESRLAWESRAALNRIGKPEEIAKVITFLLSKEASFVNGQTIFVDGCSTKSYL